MWGNLVSLFMIFLPLSFVTIGGGQSIVAEVHKQVVENHHWLTERQFTDDFALSRAAPGPGSLLVTIIGWQVAGFMGALVSTVAIYTPACLMTYGVANVWKRYRGARWQKALEGGLRPVAGGLILATVYVLMNSLSGGWVARSVALASTALLVTTKMNPMYMLLGGAAVFIALRGILPA